MGLEGKESGCHCVAFGSRHTSQRTSQCQCIVLSSSHWLQWLPILLKSSSEYLWARLMELGPDPRAQQGKPLQCEQEDYDLARRQHNFSRDLRSSIAMLHHRLNTKDGLANIFVHHDDNKELFQHTQRNRRCFHLSWIDEQNKLLKFESKVLNQKYL